MHASPAEAWARWAIPLLDLSFGLPTLRGVLPACFPSLDRPEELDREFRTFLRPIGPSATP